MSKVTTVIEFSYSPFYIFRKVIFRLRLYIEEVNMQIYSMINAKSFVELPLAKMFFTQSLV